MLRGRSASSSAGLLRTQRTGETDQSDSGQTRKGSRRASGGPKKRNQRRSRSSSIEGKGANFKTHTKKRIANVKLRSNIIEEDKEEESGEKRKPPRKMSSSSDRPKLAIGTEIRCKDGSYLVERLLGSGGFGDVYKVKRNGTAEFYALKTELNEFNGRKVDRLKLEVTVMTALASLRDPDKRKHFVQLIDKGKTRHFKLIVMQMVGPSIEDIRRRILCTDFTNRTAMYISQETLEGIRDLHTAGFIHRDIKPQNFAIGIGDKEKTIYVLDLGIAHRFVDKRTGGHKPARPKVRFMGTIRYASRNCHRSKEQSRKDDLEAWIYMSVELYSVSALPWRRVADKHKVLMEKDRFFLAPCAYTYKKAPEGYKSISKYIDNLTYEEEPNYSVIQNALEEIMKHEGMNAESPLDWVDRDVNAKHTRNVNEACAERTGKEKIESKEVNVDREEDLKEVDGGDGERQGSSPASG